MRRMIILTVSMIWFTVSTEAATKKVAADKAWVKTYVRQEIQDSLRVPVWRIDRNYEKIQANSYAVYQQQVQTERQQMLLKFMLEGKTFRLNYKMSARQLLSFLPVMKIKTRRRVYSREEKDDLLGVFFRKGTKIRFVLEGSYLVARI